MTSFLLFTLQALRRRLEVPSKLSEQDMASIRAKIQMLGDRCHFNIGWYARGPGAELTGEAETKFLMTLLFEAHEILVDNERVVRGKGRPLKEEISREDVDVIAKFTYDNPTKKTLRQIVWQELRAKRLKDQTKTLDAHYKRIKAVHSKILKVKAPGPKTNNVLIFRPKKNPGRNPPRK